MWTVSFNEYLKFEGVRESIKRTRDKSKKSLRERSTQGIGVIIEDYITSALKMTTELDVVHTTPQMDCGFGADYKASYTKNGVGHSFFIDVTMADKQAVKYINIKGSAVDKIEDALVLQMKDFDVRFGIKERHMNWFFYHKPVVVLSIRLRNRIDVNAFTPLDELDAANLSHVLRTVNDILVDNGHGARASQKVRPNLKMFRMEYLANKKTNK